MLDRKFWHGVIRTLDEEIRTKKQTSGVREFPVLTNPLDFKWANVKASLQEKGIISKPVSDQPIANISCFRAEWVKKFETLEYQFIFSWHSWSSSYQIIANAEEVESPYFALIMVEEVSGAD